MPSRVEASEEIVVMQSAAKCYLFFTDLSNIGSCIPGCEYVTTIDTMSAIFKVKVKVGYISKTFEIKAKLKDMIQNEHLSFEGTGPDADISGNVDLYSKGNDETTVKYRIEINAVSVTGKTAISMIGKTLVKSQASDFASCVKKGLETTNS